MSLLCLQDVTRLFLSGEGNITPKHILSRHGCNSALIRGMAWPRGGLGKHNERLNVTPATAGITVSWTSSHTSKSMQVQPKHVKMYVYLHETHV